jgi:hypothetical protein
VPLKGSPVALRASLASPPSPIPTSICGAASASPSVAVSTSLSPASITTLDELISALEARGQELSGLQARLLSRHGTSMDGLHRMSKKLAHAESALESAALDLEQAADRANERVRRLQEHSKQERASLVRAALASLQQLRVHLTRTMSGLKLSHPSEQLGAKQEAFAWRQKRSRWGVTESSGQSMIVRLDVPLAQLKEAMSSLSSRHQKHRGAAIRAADGDGSGINAKATPTSVMPTPPVAGPRTVGPTPRSPQIGSATRTEREHAEPPYTACSNQVGFGTVSLATMARRPQTAEPHAGLRPGLGFLTPPRSSEVDPKWLAAASANNRRALMEGKDASTLPTGSSPTVQRVRADRVAAGATRPIHAEQAVEATYESHRSTFIATFHGLGAP